MNFYAPDTYYEASPELRAKVVNGCGPGGWKFNPIPQHIFGADIREVCNIHDWNYHEGHDKQRADVEFLANLVIACENAGLSMDLALPLCCTYFLAVHDHGDAYFGKD